MTKNSHHVVHSHNGGWAVKKSGADRASVSTETKVEAIKIGRIISQRQGTELVIHGSDGKIQSSDSHGKNSRR